MSGAERKRRENYRKFRKRWIFIQFIVLAVVAAAILIVSLLYRNLNETVYITYRETSAVDYKVKLKENNFYEEEWLDKDQAYVASLIDSVNADFSYELDMDVKNADYEYSYKIETQLEILDDNSKAAIFDPVYTLKEVQNIKQSSNNKLFIQETALIDYAQYNDLANQFNEAYDLRYTTSSLIIRMSVNVVGSCEEFQENSENHYVVSLRMPLTEQAITIQMQSTVPTGENKVLACDSDFNGAAFRGAIVGLSITEAVLIVGFICFVFLTRNEDINYAIRVQKLLSGYSSYIQKINNEFDASGYQLLAVDTFNEMLAIRDTIQSPILMSENKDKTRAIFLIPTNTRILYTYEIKVENYDELYGESETAAEPTVIEDEYAAAETAPSTEPEAVEEIPEAVEEIPETASEEETEIETVPAEETESAVEEEETEPESRFGSRVRFNYSFEAKLALASTETRTFYKLLTDYVRAYGVKVVRSWKRERIYLGRNLFALLAFRGNKLVIALAMDPATAHPKYHARDMSAVKKYEKTPMLMRITSNRKVKYAVELLTQLFVEAGLENKYLPVKSKLAAQRSKKYLLMNHLIRLK